MKKKLIFSLLFFITIYSINLFSEETVNLALWAHPPDIGKDLNSVKEFVSKCKKANVNLIILLVKDTSGKIYWHSKKFKEAIAPGWEEFDIVEEVIKESHKNGIKVHGWFCNFTESVDSYIYLKHPEWAMVNPSGTHSDSEKLGEGRSYGIVWMCPNRKPGYAYQWLLPMMEEILTLYEIDGIHHDYVRYPGDVAPDTYCFCDYCLDDFFRYNHFVYDVYPDLILKPDPVLPRIEANWHLEYTAKPSNWKDLNRKEKAKYILKGSFLPEANPDLNYFFYEYRSDVITRFVRESTLALKKIKPDVEISAAVFKNPMQSGRFIGQRWIDFAPWVDIMMPMCYRSHFQGSFENHIEMLGEYAEYEKKWAENLTKMYIGIATTYLYKEEYEPLNSIIYSSESIMKGLDVDKNCEMLRNEYSEKLEIRLKKFPDYHEKISDIIDKLLISKDLAVRKFYAENLTSILIKLRNDPPPGYFPGEKLERILFMLKDKKVEGIVIFAAGSLNREKLWQTLEKSVSK
ncbi:MAG: family 10 glycosylhydrolase [Acidobacteriota bacterium]